MGLKLRWFRAQFHIANYKTDKNPDVLTGTYRQTADQKPEGTYRRLSDTPVGNSSQTNTDLKQQTPNRQAYPCREEPPVDNRETAKVTGTLTKNPVKEHDKVAQGKNKKFHQVQSVNIPSSKVIKTTNIRNEDSQNGNMQKKKETAANKKPRKDGPSNGNEKNPNKYLPSNKSSTLNMETPNKPEKEVPEDEKKSPLKNMKIFGNQPKDILSSTKKTSQKSKETFIDEKHISNSNEVTANKDMTLLNSTKTNIKTETSPNNEQCKQTDLENQPKLFLKNRKIYQGEPLEIPSLKELQKTNAKSAKTSQSVSTREKTIELSNSDKENNNQDVPYNEPFTFLGQNDTIKEDATFKFVDSSASSFLKYEEFET